MSGAFQATGREAQGPGEQVSHSARAEALHRGERGGREGVAPGRAWGWGLPSKQLRRWAEARKRHSLEWDADLGDEPKAAAEAGLRR